jgi:ribosome maturation factor RimP
VNVGFRPRSSFRAFGRLKCWGAGLAETSSGAGTEMTSGGPDALERALSPVVGAFGLEVVDTEHSGGTLRVTVEGGEPIDLDRLARVSAAVSAFLDERPDLAPNHRYELEVSTPGLERRLRRAAHFAGAVGQRVAVRTVATAPGDRRAEGTLVGADEAGFSLTLDDSSTRRIAYADVDRAHTIFDWKAALKSAKRDARQAQDARAVR